MAFLLDAAKRAGVEVTFGTPWTPGSTGDETIIDCRGLGARDELPDLRGVRGERIVVRTREVDLQRPVRLLHPRHPLYVVPWGDGLFMVGASVIESEDSGPVSVRSVLELLGSAYALHPAFGEAEIVDMGAGVRPSSPTTFRRSWCAAARSTSTAFTATASCWPPRSPSSPPPTLRPAPSTTACSWSKPDRTVTSSQHDE